jgi:hypothetical protein
MRMKRTAAIGLIGAALGLLVLPAAAAAVQPEARVAISTTVDPARARPGDAIMQLAEVTNTGQLGLLRLVAQLDARAGCTTVIEVLPPRQTTTVACAATAYPGHPVLTATVRGSSPLGGALYARATTAVTFPAPAQRPRIRSSPPPESEPEPTPTSSALPPAPRPEPSSARARPSPPRPPARAAPSRHRANPTPPAAPPAPPRGATAHGEPRQAPATAAPVVAAAAPAPVRAPLPDTAARPLANPTRTAAVIAVLGVTIMTMTVGAFTAALRVR